VVLRSTRHPLKKTVHAAEQRRPDVASARHHWKTALQQKLDPKKLVFIDETGTATNMARARLIGRVPHCHWKTTTMVAGLRIDR